MSMQPPDPPPETESHSGAGAAYSVPEAGLHFPLLWKDAEDDAIFMLDPAGRVISRNAAAQCIADHDSEEESAQPISMFCPTDELPAGERAELLGRAAADGCVAQEGWRMRRDGSRFRAGIVITALRGPDGVLQGYAKVIRDLSARHAAEQRLIDARARIESAGRARSDFLARMSQELRSPLNSMLMLAELLADNSDGRLSPREVKYAQTINEAGLDLLAMVGDLLDLARIESGAELPLTIADMEWDTLRARIGAAFGRLARTKGIEFGVAIDRTLPRFIRTDEKRLQQILRHLLGNAFRFTQAGSVRLHIARAMSGWTPGHSLLDRGAVVAIAVTDTGKGIAQAQLNAICLALRRKTVASAIESGAGLGLSISRELAMRLGGELRISSEDGKGSTVTLYLPLVLPRRI